MTEADARYALYYTPAHHSKLERFGSAVVGRDLESDAPVAPPASLDVDGETLAALTGDARRYGFHATLKAPFRIDGHADAEELLRAVDAFCAVEPPVNIGPLQVALLGGFVALVPVAPPAALSLLAAQCVAMFDKYRAPLSDAERKRRRVEHLSARQNVLLSRWGYPYVFDEFRYHMTLTSSLSAGEREGWRARLAAAYQPIAATPVTIDAISVLRQNASGPFRLVERVPLRG